MKTLRKIIQETNVSAGMGVRGFGDVTGNPATTDDSENSHIDRVVQGAEEYNNLVQSFITNHNTTSVLDEPVTDNWWAKASAKGTALTMLGKPVKTLNKIVQEGMEAKHYEAIDDVHVNLENRNHAIEEYGYGPMNPNESNKDFWKEKSDLWKTTIDEAQKSRCYNCAAFNKSKTIINKIATALGPAGKTIVQKSDLGFCEMFHFKCAGARTCDAWLMNGPIKEETSVSGIAGTGDERLPADQREPGVSVAAQKRHHGNVLRRAPPQSLPVGLEMGMFAGKPTVVVESDLYEKLSSFRGIMEMNKYLSESDYGMIILEYITENSDVPVIFENKKTGCMCFARYGK
jgi:hypothetical protein